MNGGSKELQPCKHIPSCFECSNLIQVVKGSQNVSPLWHYKG